MEWTSVDLDNCPIVRALDVLGNRWTLIVLRESLNGVHRFEDFLHHLGVSPSVLSKRLREMVDQGLLVREPYREPGGRERHEYHPTQKAWELYPVLVGLMQWGDRYLGDPTGPPVRLVDSVSGQPVMAAVVPSDAAVCSPADIRVEPGESLKLREADGPD
ncbi:winged helix-turn-helix transcriptional regulator [Nocardia noduli]|uniref:winged helix-turn-helix transcriptional regulator n=1 Tax=Nocardia noduli TaxID=2815722 RepID=UPI001C228308|nr:helix-turn-helix domain-containing protein [Nocardia noduli]